jgi:eukaryotic-like serine/threonine-protein kinase
MGIDADRWAEIERIFHAAAARQGAERAALLADACAGDADLRREVESLLAGSASAEGVLDRGGMAAAVALVGQDAGSALTGRRFGPYRVVAPLGAGGMGEVYRAHDTRLERDVALKILPAAFTASPDRLDRFEREARVLAALNHPHIGAIYGLEPVDGVQALVLELVEGETLAERLARSGGQLRLKDALDIARQIAEALDAAHEKGIVHRDLKPGNIKITPDGAVKVLDFGIAKLDPRQRGTASTEAPTVGATREGLVVGTAAYMSPEQARGQAIDRRTDIWAFGCVLYEMLAGRGPFERPTVSDTIAAILEREPDWSKLAAAAPPGVVHLIRRCLQKDRRLRLRDIGDVGFLIDDGSARPQQGPRVAWLSWTLAAAAVAAAGLAWLSRPSPVPEAKSFQFQINAPEGLHVDNEIATGGISPDGLYAVLAASRQGPGPLWLRPLDSLTARPLPGTEGANSPFWSPDSRSIAFYQNGKLRLSEIAGGPPVVVCDATDSRTAGGTWNRDGTILFASAGRLFRVPASGGEPRIVAEPDTARGELERGHPQFLPDGQRFLYFVLSQTPGIQGVYAASLDHPHDAVRVLATAQRVSYLPPRLGRPAYLFWLRERTLMAQPFDTDSLRLHGEITRVADDVLVNQGVPNRAAFWTSEAGAVAYRAAPPPDATLRWVSRTGTAPDEIRGIDRYVAIQLRHDAGKIALDLRDEGGNLDIWVMNADGGSMTRLTFDPAADTAPVWSPGGSQIAFSSDRTGVRQLYRTAAAGGALEEELTGGPNDKIPWDWSPDGRYLLYAEVNPQSGFDLLALPVDGDRIPVAIARTPGLETFGQFSPDGKWVAFSSDVSGQMEVYVQPFPADGRGPWRVSTEGGVTPRWRGDGRELFYAGQQGIIGAPIDTTGSEPKIGAPRELFAAAALVSNLDPRYDVARDGQRFLLLHPLQEEVDLPLTVIANWRP